MEGSGYFMLIGRYKQSGGKLLLKEGQTLALVLAKQKMGYGINRNPLFKMVGTRGFEPPTTRPPVEYATSLRHVPNSNVLGMFG